MANAAYHFHNTVFIKLKPIPLLSKQLHLLDKNYTQHNFPLQMFSHLQLKRFKNT